MRLRRKRSPRPPRSPRPRRLRPARPARRTRGARRRDPVAAFAGAGPPGPERTVAPRAADAIGDLLRGEAPADSSRLVVAAQSALAKLGYSVKADGAQGAATDQALREFEKAHGLPISTEITPRLVKQLNSAARSSAR